MYAGDLGALLNFDNNQNLQYEHKSRLDSVQKAKEEIKEIQKKEYETDSAATCDSTIRIIACGLSAAVDWYDQRDYANNGRITTTSDGRSYYYQSKEREKEIEISKAIIENKEKEITSLFDPLYKE